MNTDSTGTPRDEFDLNDPLIQLYLLATKPPQMSADRDSHARFIASLASKQKSVATHDVSIPSTPPIDTEGGRGMVLSDRPSAEPASQPHGVEPTPVTKTIPVAETLSQSSETLGVKPRSVETEDDPFVEAIKYAINRVLTTPGPVGGWTVATVVDAAAAAMWGTSKPSLARQRVYLPIAAEIMRRTLRSLAEKIKDGTALIGVCELLQSSEALSAGSQGGHSENPAVAAIARDDWWVLENTRDPELAKLCALHYFAGRSTEVITDLLGLSRNTVRAALLLAANAVAVAESQ